MVNFLLEQLNKDEAIASLKSLINSSPDARALAVLMVMEGHLYRVISQTLGVSEFFVSHWKKAFKAEGIQAEVNPSPLAKLLSTIGANIDTPPPVRSAVYDRDPNAEWLTKSILLTVKQQ
jgi:hypothetical protein